MSELADTQKIDRLERLCGIMFDFMCDRCARRWRSALLQATEGTGEAGRILGKEALEQVKHELADGGM